MRGRAFMLWCLLAWCVPMLAHAASVTATLDRNTVQLGQTVTLNLHVQGSSAFTGMPDLSALTTDFSVLGQSQSSDLSIINGRRTAELVIGIVLRPLHAGTLTIPALDVGGAKTAPLQLVVEPASAAAAPAPGGNVFMEAAITPQHGWVGQQLSYAVRLYYRGNLSSGTLDAPQVDGVALTQVGKDLRYDQVRNGQTWQVLERDYALTPQHAGTLTVPALGFQGVALDPNDPDSFFGVGNPVTTSSPAVSVTIDPAPANWGQQAWLPARALSLTLDGWPAANTPVRVGQPINLVMHLRATGLGADALPALSMPAVDGATVYPDQPKSTTAADGPWLVGSCERTFALVPTRAGTLTMPATTVHWFDVMTGQAQTAEIPAHQLTVLPAAGAATGGGGVAPASAATAATLAAAPAATETLSRAVPWKPVALASIVLWLLSLAGWWWYRRRARRAVTAPATRRAPPPLAPDARALRAAFLAAVRDGDPAHQLHALLAWARAERPAIRQAGDLMAALGDDAQQRALAALQQRCYGRAEPADAPSPATAFEHGFAWRATEKPDDDNLPPLYPFDTGRR